MSTTIKQHLFKKILFAKASPKTAASVAWQDELKAIKSSSPIWNVQEFKGQQDATKQNFINEVTNNSSSILHFCGHGTEEDECLVFSSPTGGSDVVADPIALASIFATLTHVKLVVLNCCFSRAQAEEIAKYTAVVYYPKSLKDSAGVDFASTFYTALAVGKTVHEAFNLGTANLKLPYNPPMKPTLEPACLCSDDFRLIYPTIKDIPLKVRNQIGSKIACTPLNNSHYVLAEYEMTEKQIRAQEPKELSKIEIYQCFIETILTTPVNRFVGALRESGNLATIHDFSTYLGDV